MAERKRSKKRIAQIERWKKRHGIKDGDPEKPAGKPKRVKKAK